MGKRFLEAVAPAKERLGLHRFRRSSAPGLRDSSPAQSRWQTLLPQGAGRPQAAGVRALRTRDLSGGGTPGRPWLRVARVAAAVLRSRRAGRSSAYSFALMLFLKERDSCEQTGLTETCFHPTRPLRTHNSPGDSFLSAADFKVCNRTPVSGVTSRIWAVGASCGRAPLRLMLGCPWPG